MANMPGALMNADTVRAIYLVAGVSARKDKRAAATPAMAEGFGSPTADMHRIAHALMRKGILNPARDGSGEFFLARKPQEISPREVAELFDGPAHRKIRLPSRSRRRDQVMARIILKRVEEARWRMLAEMGDLTFADFLLKKDQRPGHRRHSKDHLAFCPFHPAEERQTGRF